MDAARARALAQAIGAALLHLDLDDEPSMARMARLAQTLLAQLEARKGKAVPLSLRDAIQSTASLADSLLELRGLVTGRVVPDDDVVGRATSLRMRWERLCRLAPDAATEHATTAVRSLVASATEAVEALVARRSADPRMATMMRRALARWGHHGVGQRHGRCQGCRVHGRAPPATHHAPPAMRPPLSVVPGTPSRVTGRARTHTPGSARVGRVGTWVSQGASRSLLCVVRVGFDPRRHGARVPPRRPVAEHLDTGQHRAPPATPPTRSCQALGHGSLAVHAELLGFFNKDRVSSV